MGGGGGGIIHSEGGRLVQKCIYTHKVENIQANITDKQLKGGRKEPRDPARRIRILDSSLSPVNAFFLVCIFFFLLLLLSPIWQSFVPTAISTSLRFPHTITYYFALLMDVETISFDASPCCAVD